MRHFEGRENLAGEHALTDIGQLVLFVLFMTVWIVDSFVIRASTLSAYVPLYIRIPLAVAALVAGVLLVRPSLRAIFGEAAQQPRVMTDGVYRIVRHPMYMGSILLFTAFLVSTLSVMTAGVWIVIIAFYFYVARAEEKLLIAKFGADYQEYRRRVPMLFPWKISTTID
jgi:protein-S-isoprenylcysteine O-methyltransferase Ste14